MSEHSPRKNLELNHYSEHSPEPNQKNNEKEQGSIILSPKSQTKKLTSPALTRHKIQTASRASKKEEQLYFQAKLIVQGLEATKADLEKRLASMHNSQNEKTENNPEVQMKKLQISQLNHELEKARHHNAEQQNKSKSELKHLDHLKKELEHKITSKKLDIEHQRNEELNNSKIRHEKEVEEITGRQKQAEINSQELLKQIKESTAQKNQHLQNLHEIQQMQVVSQNLNHNNQTDLEKKINELKVKINAKKNQIERVKAAENQNCANNSTNFIDQIKRVQTQNSELLNAKRKVQEEYNSKKKNQKELAENQTKKKNKIIDLKKKNDTLSTKAKQLKDELDKIENTQTKKVVYEEKAPEELTILLLQNEKQRKEIEKIKEKISWQKNETSKLVSPNVIENMNTRISEILSNNEKLVDIAKESDQLFKENQELDGRKEELQWGDNTQINQLDIQKKRQDQKNKNVEAELLLLNKKSLQVNNKLDQYVKAYPDFKPQKKQKKKEKEEVNPPNKKVQGIKTKKSFTQAEKSDKSPDDPKKKKNLVTNINRTISSVQEKHDNIIEQPVKEEKITKNKKKKGTTSTIPEVKEEIPEVKVEEVIIKEVTPPKKMEEPTKINAGGKNDKKSQKKKGK